MYSSEADCLPSNPRNVTHGTARSECFDKFILAFFMGLSIKYLWDERVTSAVIYSFLYRHTRGREHSLNPSAEIAETCVAETPDEDGNGLYDCLRVRLSASASTCSNRRTAFLQIFAKRQPLCFPALRTRNSESNF